MSKQPNQTAIEAQVRAALAEDLGSGDLTAALLPAEQWGEARLICREQAVLCGCAWFEAGFRLLDPRVRIDWRSKDGGELVPDQEVCRLRGPIRALLSGERTAMNFLQSLSGTATRTRRYVQAVAGSGVRLLDTRKTIPGLRLAQKYAVTQGGGANHRLGLHDAILIKENHIAAAGSISAALAQAAAQQAGVIIEIEVEDLEQLRQALAAGARHILLDNFSLDALRQAVALTAGRARLEASGGVSLDSIQAIAATGVNDISVGALTKDVQAVDFSLRVRAVTSPAATS